MELSSYLLFMDWCCFSFMKSHQHQPPKPNHFSEKGELEFPSLALNLWASHSASNYFANKMLKCAHEQHEPRRVGGTPSKSLTPVWLLLICLGQELPGGGLSSVPTPVSHHRPWTT